MASSGWNGVCVAAVLFTLIAYGQTVSADLVLPADIAAQLVALKDGLVAQVSTNNGTAGRRLLAADCIPLGQLRTSHNAKYCLTALSKTAVAQKACSGTNKAVMEAQAWAFFYVNDGGKTYALITSLLYGTCLEVKGGSKGSGAPVILHACRSVAYGIFQQIKTTTGPYKGWSILKPYHVSTGSLVLQIVGGKLVQKPFSKKPTNYFQVNVVTKVDTNGSPC